jgi:hypothetical protein
LTGSSLKPSEFTAEIGEGRVLASTTVGTMS